MPESLPNHSKKTLSSLFVPVAADCKGPIICFFSCSGVVEDLKLTVFIPFLWGVPPELDTLRWVLQSPVI